jgi:hypothetical protein
VLKSGYTGPAGDQVVVWESRGDGGLLKVCFEVFFRGVCYSCVGVWVYGCLVLREMCM